MLPDLAEALIMTDLILFHEKAAHLLFTHRLLKQVPDTWSERKLRDDDYTLDRDAADAVVAFADSAAEAFEIESLPASP